MNEDVKALLQEIAHTLENMATTSENFGWSTHQVKPQRKLAQKIWAFLGKQK